MWQNPILLCIDKKRCLKCESPVENIESYTKCNCCLGYKNIIECTECDFQLEICLKCLYSKSPQQKTKVQPESNDSNNIILYLLVAVIPVVVILLYFKYSSKVEDFSNQRLLERLREKFPSQKNETWYHILSVLEQKVPTVKSIVLLHKNDRTSDCLARELVNIFNSDVKMKDVRFVVDESKYRDYGEVLQYYYKVVKRLRVLVTNLNLVPAKIVRVFHSLCDEISSDIKPSLFIFILRCDEKMRNMKPLEKATAVLKQAWSELPDSEIFPLLSRIVKNVVDVVPEKQGC